MLRTRCCRQFVEISRLLAPTTNSVHSTSAMKVSATARSFHRPLPQHRQLPAPLHALHQDQPIAKEDTAATQLTSTPLAKSAVSWTVATSCPRRSHHRPQAPLHRHPQPQLALLPLARCATHSRSPLPVLVAQSAGLRTLA